jgi:hypothetical protein
MFEMKVVLVLPEVYKDSTDDNDPLHDMYYVLSYRSKIEDLPFSDSGAEARMRDGRTTKGNNCFSGQRFKCKG